MNRGRLELTGEHLSLKDISQFDVHRPEVTLSDSARERMQASVDAVNNVLQDNQVCYGINTGFGAFAKQRISPDQLIQLQYNLVRSHACGVGEALSPTVTRRLMLLKANSLAVGHSGIRPEIVDTLLALLNADVLPVIPGRGSVGASGDLAPLAHLALALIGEGEALFNGKHLTGEKVLTAANVKPVRLGAKEGLALLNGTQLCAALSLEGLLRAENLLGTAIVTGALSVEALAGSYTPFDERIQKVRRLRGQMIIAEKFRELLTGSEIWQSHQGCDRVQDPYALRCMPQVFGAVWDTLQHAAVQLGHECNSASDNPLIFDGDVLSGGNFHAEPLAFIADFMAIAVAELGNIAERRIDLLMRNVNPNLEMFLTATPGLESGFMIAHVTAAALASENKTLAHPASADSISTSAGQEDHVSMGAWAGHKLLKICDNVCRILAIELLAGTAAIDRLRPHRTTEHLEAVFSWVRESIPPHTEDRRLDKDIATLADKIGQRGIAEALPGFTALGLTDT